MIIRAIRLRNWLPFRGEHEILLEPATYSVVARREDDPDASNWQGKTSLLEAVRFALYGSRPDRCRLEDDWITRGEPSGAVEVELEGLVVRRERKRGSATKLTVIEDTSPKKESVWSYDADAEPILDRRLLLSLTDFDATCFFGQRETARLVNEDPGPRMKIVSEWLRLDRLKAAEEYVTSWLAKSATTLRDLDRDKAGWEGHRKNALSGDFRSYSDEEDLTKRIEELEGQSKRALEELEMRAAHREVKLRRDQYEKAKMEIGHVVERAKSLGDELAEMRGEEELEAEEGIEASTRDVAVAEVARLTRERASHLGIAEGGFEGTCPVDGQTSCPIRDRITSSVRSSMGRLVEIGQRIEGVQRARSTAEANLIQIRRAKEDRRAKEQAIKSACDELARRKAALPKEAPPRPEDDATGVGYDQARADRDFAMSLLSEVKVKLGHLRQADAELAKIAARREEEQGRARLYEEALRVLGRGGVRRAIVEPFLSSLEGGANEALAECGVDLSVRALWEHEGRDPARSCGACGASFAASERVKACERCGSPRGRHKVERLEFELSDRSAAAEDLAGIALQLAASAHLREARGSVLETALLDEPLGACDKRNRRNMARAFAAMLGRFGFRQALVVSHDAATQAAFPGTILVTGGPKGSRLEVVG